MSLESNMDRLHGLETQPYVSNLTSILNKMITSFETRVNFIEQEMERVRSSEGKAIGSMGWASYLGVNSIRDWNPTLLLICMNLW